MPKQLQKTKQFLVDRLGMILLVLVAIQPLLDVLSYFLSEMGSNAFSTVLRFGMLMLVALFGFFLSETKRYYLILYGIVAVFWAVHVANGFRVGYISVVQDTANFLRILNFPIFALTFITVLSIDSGLRKYFYLGTAVAFGEMILFTALPWLTGNPVYTYPALPVGIMGWFVIPNAQAVILVLSAPIAIYWAYSTGKYPLYLAAAVLCFGMMFATGTKFTFYSIFIIAGAYAFLFVVQMGKRCLKYALPMLALFGLVFAFRHQSPMALRERMSAYSQGILGEAVEESLENSGVDEKIIDIIKNEGEEEEKPEENVPVTPPEKVRAKMRQGLMDIYTDEEIYGKQLNNMNERFGVYNVMEVFHHSAATGLLSDFRATKTFFAELIWSEKDLFTKFLGVEYSDFVVDGIIYDLENDFPAVYYCCGYIGFGLYMLFFAIFVLAVLKAFGLGMLWTFRADAGKPGNWLKRTAASLYRGLKGFLTVELGAMGMSFLLAVIAAQYSGYVLRRPNVTIYFAISAACLLSLCAKTGCHKRQAEKKKLAW